MSGKTSYFKPHSFIVFVLLSLQSCDYSEQEVVPEEPEQLSLVDPALRPYFQRFETEARLRGIEADLTEAGIEGVIEEIQDGNVAGQCSYDFRNPHKITIDQSFWNNGSDLYKEFIVFHELGHCFLERGHLEDQFSNGICVSIMRSGKGSCRDFYNNNSRDYYIDELFDPTESSSLFTRLAFD